MVLQAFLHFLNSTSYVYLILLIWKYYLLFGFLKCMKMLISNSNSTSGQAELYDRYRKVAWNLNETCVCLQSCVYIESRDSDGPITTTLENLRNLSIQNWELRFLICCWDSKVRTGLELAFVFQLSNMVVGNSIIVVYGQSCGCRLPSETRPLRLCIFLF